MRAQRRKLLAAAALVYRLHGHQRAHCLAHGSALWRVEQPRAHRCRALLIPEALNSEDEALERDALDLGQLRAVARVVVRVPRDQMKGDSRAHLWGEERASW